MRWGARCGRWLCTRRREGSEPCDSHPGWLALGVQQLGRGVSRMGPPLSGAALVLPEQVSMLSAEMLEIVESMV